MQLATLLGREREAILDDWEAAVRRCNSPTASLPRDELRDDIPPFLDRLVAWLATSSTDTHGAVDRQTTGAHALHRLRHGLELKDLIHEFRLLRQTILRRILPAAAEVDNFVPDVARVADAIDHALAESATVYAAARDEAREIVLAILGHDLANPVSAIAMSAEVLLRGGGLTPRDVPTVDRIARSAERVKRIVADLLDLARSRFGGQMPIRPAPADLAEVTQQVVDELRLSNPERNLSVTVEGDVHGDWDRVRLAQVVSNLLANAIRHGRDPITVALRGHEAEVELAVANRGTPIPRELQPTLFDPFRRAPPISPDAGLGLGLYIVAQIVRAHHGTVSLRSDDQATVFTVRLPRHAAIG